MVRRLLLQTRVGRERPLFRSFSIPSQIFILIQSPEQLQEAGMTIMVAVIVILSQMN